eukprot:m.35543 g.35543  ORF g.35543 m.35543 type:complete len:265 (+) comp5297_c0_seq2:286-1080(+)
MVSGIPHVIRGLRQLREAGVTAETITAALSVWVPEERRAKMAAVAERRLPRVTCVLEGLYDLGNVGAVARSAESFGVTSLGVVCLHGDTFKARQGGRTSSGADAWINFSKYQSTEECFQSLRADGHRILVASCLPAGGRSEAAIDTAASPTDLNVATSSVRLEDVEWTASERVAVVFGNEYMGLSSAAVDLADESFHIDTHGFTQSLNVSVAAAIVFHELSRRLPRPTEEEQGEQLAEMYLRMALKRGVQLPALLDLCRQHKAS